MLRSFAFSAIALVTLVACSDRDSQALADSELARDLALANQTPVYPQFADSAERSAQEPQRIQPQPPPRQTKTTTRTSTTPRRQTSTVVERPRPSAPQPVVEQPAPAPAPAPRRVAGFGAGTSFSVSTGAEVCTTNLPGDKIVATLDHAVIGENGAYLPAGTPVVLEVASVTPGDQPEAAHISLRVRSVVINDEVVNVPSTVSIQSDLERRARPDGGSDKKKVIGGAIAGAIIGQVVGRDTRSTVIGAAAGTAAGAAAAAASRKYDACLPAGSQARVTTSQQITLST
jgi:hypothetical protein